MNRRKNELIGIEIALLIAALRLLRAGEREFHGFLIAKTVEGSGNAPSLLGHGTLYKALSRLEERGLLSSRWEGSLAGDDRVPAVVYEPRPGEVGDQLITAESLAV